MTLNWASDAAQMSSARWNHLSPSGTSGCQQGGSAGLGVCAALPGLLAGSRMVLQTGLQLPNDCSCSVVGALRPGRPVGLPPLRPLQPRYVAAVAHLLLRGQLPDHELLQYACKQPRLQQGLGVTQGCPQQGLVGSDVQHCSWEPAVCRASAHSTACSRAHDMMKGNNTVGNAPAEMLACSHACCTLCDLGLGRASPLAMPCVLL